jgi:hypothetical protein
MALIGGGWAFLSEKAFGATDDKVTSKVLLEPSCSTSGDACPVVKKKHRRSARQFRNGKFHRSDGFAPAAVFKKPKASRRIFVRKIRRVMENAQSSNTSAKYAAMTGDLPCHSTDRSCAFKIYRDMVSNSTCADRGVAYPTSEANTCYLPSTRRITKEDVQVGGAVILCGGAVAIGVATSTASGGTTAFVAAWGATSCGWAFWSSID